MPKESKQKIKHTYNYPQSLKKTHCTEYNYYYNQKQTEFLHTQPENHWSKDTEDTTWEYYTFLINQIHISAIQFKESGDWRHWSYIQKHYHILKTLINDSTNLTYLNPDQVKTLNEKIRKNFEPTGKATQEPAQNNQ